MMQHEHSPITHTTDVQLQLHELFVFFTSTISFGDVRILFYSLCGKKPLLVIFTERNDSLNFVHTHTVHTPPYNLLTILFLSSMTFLCFYFVRLSSAASLAFAISSPVCGMFCTRWITESEWLRLSKYDESNRIELRWTSVEIHCKVDWRTTVKCANGNGAKMY